MTISQLADPTLLTTLTFRWTPDYNIVIGDPRTGSFTGLATSHWLAVSSAARDGIDCGLEPAVVDGKPPLVVILQCWFPPCSAFPATPDITPTPQPDGVCNYPGYYCDWWFDTSDLGPVLLLLWPDLCDELFLPHGYYDYPGSHYPVIGPRFVLGQAYWLVLDWFRWDGFGARGLVTLLTFIELPCCSGDSPTNHYHSSYGLPGGTGIDRSPDDAPSPDCQAYLDHWPALIPRLPAWCWHCCWLLRCWWRDIVTRLLTNVDSQTFQAFPIRLPWRYSGRIPGVPHYGRMPQLTLPGEHGNLPHIPHALTPQFGQAPYQGDTHTHTQVGHYTPLHLIYFTVDSWAAQFPWLLLLPPSPTPDPLPPCPWWTPRYTLLSCLPAHGHCCIYQLIPPSCRAMCPFPDRLGCYLFPLPTLLPPTPVAVVVAMYAI